MEAKVLNGHALSDLVSEEQLFIAADLNGIGITEALTPGEFIEVPEVLPSQKVEIRVIPAMIVARTEKVLNGHDLSNLVEEEQLFEAADLNDISITELLTAGVVLTLPEPTKKVAVEVIEKTIITQLKKKVIEGNELGDFGGDDALFELADLNGIGITEILTAGITLSVTESKSVELERLTVTPDKQLTRSLAGQAWIDMCLQEIGTEDNLFDMADLNDVSITDDIAPGTPVLSIADMHKEVVRVLQKVKPASRTRPENDSDTGEIMEGIEFWGIEFDFVVS